MKKIIFGLFLLSGTSAIAAVFQDFYSQGLNGPESILYDAQAEVFYISNVSGDGLKYDRDGWISKVGANGEVIEEKWSSHDLHAPKGLGIMDGVLYVADINYLVLIDLTTSTIIKKVFVENSTVLNDVVTDEANQVVYVSDTMGNAIYSYSPSKGKIKLLVEGDHLESPNGLFVQDEKLIVASWGRGIKADWSTDEKGSLYTLDLQTLEKSVIISNLGNLDGVEADPNDEETLLVTDWVAGTLLKIQNGTVTSYFTGIEGAADIGVRLSGEKTEVFVPSMTTNKIINVKP